MLTGVQDRWLEKLIASIFLVSKIAFSQESILYHVPPENVSSGESAKIIVSLFCYSRVLTLFTLVMINSLSLSLSLYIYI